MYKLLIVTIYISLLTTATAVDLIKPIPTDTKLNQNKVELGKRLFSDPTLSRDGTISCATCHILNDGGDDNLQFSFGINGQEGNVNAPTVYNATFNFHQFWDGRAKDLQEQAKGPLENPIEMGNTLDEVVKTLKSDREYRNQFVKTYHNGITIENITDAIAEFEKALTTPDSRFDLYLKGNPTAINKEEVKGYRLFISKGCIICHHGVNIGGNMYNKFGIFKEINSTNLGHYNVTKRDEDRYVFKVPSLRNIDKTAPYMHNGDIKTLRKAVTFMAQYQLGREMGEDEIDAIVSFLKTLTGKIPEVAK